MRLTLVIHALDAGGAERNLIRLANFWAEHGCMVTMLTFDDGQSPPFFPLNPKITHIPLNIHTGRFNMVGKILSVPRIILSLRKAILLTKPDVTIAFVDQVNILTILATLGTGIAPIVSERADPDKTSLALANYPRIIRQFVRFLRALIYTRSSGVVVQTEASRSYFPQSLQDKLVVIPNAVKIDTCAVVVKDKLELPARYILGVGRLARQKRFDRLIIAFSKICDAFPDLNLCIAGEGVELANLQELVRTLKLHNRVIFLGKVRDVVSIMQKAEIFVLSSDYEGFPGALCEAMALGKPVIATRCRYGPEEIIENNTDGLLVELSNDALADAIQKLASSEALRNELGKRALQITERFSEGRIMELWRALIERKLRQPDTLS